MDGGSESKGEESQEEDMEEGGAKETKYKLDEEERSILRTLFSGGPKSDARLIKAKVIKWRPCQHCTQQVVEDADHIFGTCQAWKKEREAGMGKDAEEQIRKMDPCLRTMGIVPKDTELEEEVERENKKLKHEEEEEGMPPDRNQGETEDELWVWRRRGQEWQRRLVAATDGSCPDQQMPMRFRRSAAALFVGKGHAMNCSIKLKTKAQGAQRAEVKGAARWAAWAQVPMELWTDSEQVVKGLNSIRDRGFHGRKKA